ncbi:MAG TPA: DUF1499 domain-containing protein [Gemmatimonadetes bacterium]|nr:DUF1499 domain-containing protein [Gemmatimonadota bacterium]HIL90719.1 DUF1499 domain-containing protein [Gemmatimonadota bacterium]
MKWILQGLSGNHAHTDVSATDPRLRGRTYAIPFDGVWKTALRISNKQMRGWSVLYIDDQTGVIVAEALRLPWRDKDDVRISIGLDENGQTRVDLRSTSRQGKRDWGRNRRRILSFLRLLDRELSARPDQILNQS